ncbi:MAG: 4'-phosphopantetheinyl transferase superfamily protein [Nitrosomonas sp.]|nr:MAG: 4'-phosphopantetheinyl transferase superfamily protein [Nitrosomonas sp.]
MSGKICGTAPVYASLDAIFSGTSFSFSFCIEVKNTDVLYAEEKALMMKQGFSQLTDFCKGRYCAHQALEKIGYLAFPILRDEYGAPIWPEGITGSISHSGDAAAAVVARKTNIQGIGLDLQKREIFPSAVLSVLFHDEEVASFLSIPSDLADLYAYAIFSAKESAIKCFYAARQYLAHLNEIVIAMDWSSGTFSAFIPATQNPKSFTSDLELMGRVGFDERYVFSAAWQVT